MRYEDPKPKTLPKWIEVGHGRWTKECSTCNGVTPCAEKRMVTLSCEARAQGLAMLECMPKLRRRRRERQPWLLWMVWLVALRFWSCGLNAGAQNLPDRPSPREVLVEEGLHPHPGPGGVRHSSLDDPEAWDPLEVEEPLMFDMAANDPDEAHAFAEEPCDGAVMESCLDFIKADACVGLPVGMVLKTGDKGLQCSPFSQMHGSPGGLHPSWKFRRPLRCWAPHSPFSQVCRWSFPPRTLRSTRSWAPYSPFSKLYGKLDSLQPQGKVRRQPQQAFHRRSPPGRRGWLRLTN